MTTSGAPATSLPTDLASVVAEVGVPLRAVALVTPLRSARLDRGCFRLTFADGRVLKGRHVESVERADRLEALTARLDPRSFPPVLARRGRALLTAWVDGTPLDRVRPSPAVLDACGGLQAAVHRIVVEPRAEWRRRPADWPVRLASSLRVLVDAAGLGSAEARQAEALAVGYAPPRASLGLCHGDLCPENVVLARDGRVVVVDNDSIAVDAYGFDLARTWYRWPMSDAQARRYMRGYGPAEHLDEVEAHFVHWAVVVVVEAAAFRHGAGLAGAGAAIGRLRALLRHPERCARFPGRARGAVRP